MATWTIELIRDVTLDSSGNGEVVASLSREGVLVDPNWIFTGKPTDALNAAKLRMADYEQQLKESVKFRAGQRFTVTVS